MKQDYFIDNIGRIIKSGTTIKTKPISISKHLDIENVIFKWYDTEAKTYMLTYKGCFRIINQPMFDYFYIEPITVSNYNSYMQHEKHITQRGLKNELLIDELFLAWVWYILLMIITLFFKGFIFYWCFITLIFRQYRKTKLNEKR